MKWLEQNQKDAEVVARMHLEALDVTAGTGSEQVLLSVQNHNANVARWQERKTRLADDRRRLVDDRNWLDCDSSRIEAERLRLLYEGWDLLLGLRRLLVERGEVMLSYEKDLNAQHDVLCEQRDQARAKVEKSLARERRALEKESPRQAERYVEEQVQQDEPVREAEAKIAAVDGLRDWAQSRRREAQSDVAVLARRQREFLTAWLC
ncbi:MAG: hypothetical protein JXL80_17900 [Planctomycetes bacterium]|nr:hypothetical protein [Planctomycetota bacterium]